MPGATGSFDLTVKRYETGVVSRYLHDRQVGETVPVRMEQVSKGAHIVGIAEPPPARTLEVTDGDLPF